MHSKVRKFLSQIGQKGGRKSRRQLTPEAAQKMVQLREAHRAFRNFHTSCFWSFDPGLKIGPGDISWVAETLRKNGDRAAWEVGSKLCP